jgi:ribosomal protein S3
MFKLTQKEKEILQKMGEFFYKEKSELLATDSIFQKERELERELIYQETKSLLYELKIKQIIVTGDTLLVVTSRPGMLIGVRANRITKLKEYLNMKIEIREYEGPELETYMLSGILTDV